MTYFLEDTQFVACPITSLAVHKSVRQACKKKFIQPLIEIFHSITAGILEKALMEQVYLTVIYVLPAFSNNS